MLPPANALTWFEIPAADFSRAVKFYSEIFATEIPAHERADGQPMGFFPCDFMQGKVGGAIVYNEKHKPSRQGTIVYLNGGEDLSRVLNRVEQAGGTILSPKEFVSKEIGYVAYFLDSEGNRLALHSSN